MTAFADMEAPSPLFRVHRYEYQGREHAHYWFICPGCNEAHAISDEWQFNGDFERPTFSPSFLTWYDPDPRAAEGSKYRTGWRCHSFIVDGEMRFCPDSTHALAGKSAPIPPFDAAKVMGEDA